VAQFARPASDIAIGSWTTQGGSAASLWATLDEDPADEADFAQSSLTVNDSYETLLSPVEAATGAVRTRRRAIRGASPLTCCKAQPSSPPTAIPT
jgi:hypothetical protein